MRMQNNKLLCEDIEQDKATASGFILSEKDERFKKLTVIKSGEEDIKEGEIVKVSKNAGEKTEEFGKELLIIDRRDIISID